MLNIEYILTAEFHIDKGPSILYEYPANLPGQDELAFLIDATWPNSQEGGRLQLFLLYRERQLGKFQYLYDGGCEPGPYFLYTIVINQKDALYKRGSIIKLLLIVTKLTYFKNFKPLLLICLDKYFATNDTAIVQELYHAINIKNFAISSNAQLLAMLMVKKLLITLILDLPINDKIYYDEQFRNRLLGITKENILNQDLFIRKDLLFNLIVEFNRMNIPIKIPMIQLPDTIGDYLNPTDLNLRPNLINILNAKLASSHLHDELTIYGLLTPPIIVLINAILTGKRIMVMLYENLLGYIIDHILLILKLITGGGILSGLFQYNLFPIMDVSKIDLLEQCQHYIAGTINPFFKNNDKLWDVLYDLDSNEFHILSQNTSPQPDIKNLIISEDAKFLSNLQMSLFTYNDDLTTIQLIFRRHINEIIRILLSSKNFSNLLLPRHKGLTLLMDGIGYYWHLDTNKLLEVLCYQLVAKKFEELVFQEKLVYNLLLPNLANELNLMIDLQYHLQLLNNTAHAGPLRINEREIWFNVLKYLILGKLLEIFLLITYLIPPSSSTLLQLSLLHGGNLTIFDKNKGIELLLINLFNKDDHIKSNIILILQELQDNFLCGWCLDNFIRSNVVYEIAFADLVEASTLRTV